MENNKFSKESNWERDVGVFAAVIIIAALITFIIDDDRTRLGPYGDWFGGVLNPLIALLALLGLSHSVKVQRNALLEARQVASDQLFAQNKQLSRQNFFDLLNLRAVALSGIKWKTLEKDKHGSYTGKVLYFEGRDAIKEILRLFIDEKPKVAPVFEKDKARELGIPEEADKTLSEFLYFFSGCYSHKLDPHIMIGGYRVKHHLLDMELEIGHLFRATYQILKFTFNCKEFTEQEKFDLINYLRAQMSESEFVLYALSACSKIGKRSRAVSIYFDFFEDRLNNMWWAREFYALFNPEIESNIIFAKNNMKPKQLPLKIIKAFKE